MPSMISESASSHIRRHWAVFLGLAAAFIVWCSVDVYRRGIVDPAQPWLHMTDFTVYTEAGAAFFDGREPYDVANIRGWKYLYPPLFALLVAPLHALGPEWQVSVWFAMCAVMCFGCYFECRRLLRPADADSIPVWLFATALLAVLFPALNCLQRGQMGIALVYPLLLGFRLVLTGESPRAWLCGGMVLALPVAFKLTPALPVGCLLFVLFVAAAKRNRDWTFPAIWSSGERFARLRPGNWPRAVWSASGAAVGVVLFFLLIPAGLVGWSANLRHLATWHARVVSKVNDVKTEDFGGDVVSLRNQSLSNAVYRCGNWLAYQFAGGPDDHLIDTTDNALGAMPMDNPHVDRAVFVLRIAALLALCGVAWRAGSAGDLLSIGSAFGLACVATLVFSPVARGHYFVLLLPAAVFVPLKIDDMLANDAQARRRAFLTAVVPALLSVLHYVALDYAGRVGALGIGISVWYFMLCVALLQSPRAVCSDHNGVSGPAETVRQRKAG